MQQNTKSGRGTFAFCPFPFAFLYMRYFITLRYLGTRFFGWQRQPNQPSVQAAIEDALSLLLKKKVGITGCGRTDTGVHARFYVAHFDFDENKLTGLFKGAKKLGVDMFLLDDGWFGNKHPRNDDHAGLGDWQENKLKLPHGIGHLVKEATAAGVKFGIWVEPEMVNPRSELYEKHKDWVLREPERPEHYFRNQLVLDLTNPEVQDFVFGVLDNMFTKNPNIAFIKWDCNAVIYNAHSEYLAKTKQKQSKLYVDYVK